MNDIRPVMLSGIQPSGAPHIGNYFGMMKPLVELQPHYTTYAMVVDYHALTTVHNSATMRANIKNVVLDMLGAGIDPETTTFFCQSDVPEHAELAWIFNCITTMPWLSRAHAYKDKTDKGIEASVGLFDYPILMAADILMYDAEVIPVGDDQRQHVEMAREIARKFNSTFATAFPVEPTAHVIDSVAIVPGTDGNKMSKSYKNTIPLFGSDEDIQKVVMSIVTDSGEDIPQHVYALHSLFLEPHDRDVLYETNRGKYKILKEHLAQTIIDFVTPLRERRAFYEAQPDVVQDILDRGAANARQKAQEKMKLVHDCVGFTRT